MVSLDRHLDYRHAALAGELLAAAARPPMPDAIRLIVMGAHAGPPPLFAAPPVVMRPRPAWHDDVVEGELSEAGHAPRARGDRRRGAGHPARSRSGLRCLLPRPGVQRAVAFGDFKKQLGAQLAHPERLRDEHRLPCCVQLYRIVDAQPRLEVARRLLGAGGAATDLLMFTPEVARRLQLPPPRVSATRTEANSRESPWLDAGEEVVELRVIHDHTQDAGSAENAPVPPRTPAPIAQPAAAPAAVISPADAAPAVPAVRTTVPARFLASPGFQLTREEALFDMTVAASAHGLLAGLRRVARRLRGRGELERWRALLDGRERDEQLWQVRPPKVALTDHRSREWVRRALTLGGYDTGHMLREWELYWRRRGV